jgi:sugar-specific transcriptional regulator TrmB
VSVDAAVSTLGELGFSPYEARVYYALLQRSPMNGHEISKQSGVPTSKVYETVERLRGKNAVMVYESDPVRYAPTPFRDLLTNYSDRLAKTLDDASRVLAQVATETDARLTWSVTGQGNLVEALRNAVRHAERRLVALLPDTAAESLAPDLQAAAERGVAVEVVVAGENQPDLPGSLRVRRIPPHPAGRLGLVVGDDEETVVTAPDATAGVWTHHPAVALLARQHVAALMAGGSG